jgi:hypothetical protein
MFWSFFYLRNSLLVEHPEFIVRDLGSPEDSGPDQITRKTKTRLFWSFFYLENRLMVEHPEVSGGSWILPKTRDQTRSQERLKQGCFVFFYLRNSVLVVHPEVHERSWVLPNTRDQSRSQERLKLGCFGLFFI